MEIPDHLSAFGVSQGVTMHMFCNSQPILHIATILFFINVQNILK